MEEGTALQRDATVNSTSDETTDSKTGPEIHWWKVSEGVKYDVSFVEHRMEGRESHDPDGPLTVIS